MSIEKVREFFTERGLGERVMEFPVSSATVEEAAIAVGTIPARIAKSLTFMSKEGNCIMIIAAGDTKIDNSKFKQKFGTKAKMLTPDEVVAFTGHAIGGVCPFAVGDKVKVYLDEGLRRFETVFPACGSSNSAIELSCDELFCHSGAIEWADVCKPIIQAE